MIDISRPKFHRIEGCNQCGDCVNFKPLSEGDTQGVCMAKFNLVYVHFCCSFPKEFKSIVGTQLSLF